jgi:hypothetical protein
MPLRIGLVFILSLTGALPAWSQSQAASAQLSGTVLDENGATVPGAKVTLSNPDTRQVTSSKPTQDGSIVGYSPPVLLPVIR